MIGYLYWVHLPNQCIKTEGYIGVSKNYIRRWKEHQTKLHCLHFGNAISKYGDILIWELIFTGPLEGCYQLENYFRPKPNIGWNIAQGGMTSNNFNRKLSEETKKKIGISNKGNTPWNKGKTKIYSKETLNKIGEATKKRVQGKNNPMYKKTHSKKTKNMISEKNKGKPGLKGDKNPMAKSIICNETNEIFSTITEGANKFNITIQALSMHLQGKTKSCANHTFNYL